MDNKYYYDYEQKRYKKKKKKGNVLNIFSVILCIFMVFSYSVVGLWFFDNYFHKGNEQDRVTLSMNDNTDVADNIAKENNVQATTSQRNMDTYNASSNNGPKDTGVISKKNSENSKEEKETEETGIEETEIEETEETSQSIESEPDTEASAQSDENDLEETNTQEESDIKVSTEAETDTEVKDKEKSEKDEKTTTKLKQAQSAVAVVSDVTEVVKSAMPCIVKITCNCSTYNYMYDDEVPTESGATGIIVAESEEEIMIVTNNHVVEGADELTIEFADSSKAEAYIKGTDAKYDLAVISVFIEDIQEETLDSIAVALLGDSDNLQLGEPAIAIGNSAGYGQAVTTGVISALDRRFADVEDAESDACGYIQTDAAINPGSSGGALLNVRGEVIGINIGKMADGIIEGVGYSIPVSTAKPVIETLMENETRKKVAEEERAYLGVSGNDVTEDAAEKYDIPIGIYVTAVIDKSPAKKSGLKKGDVITAVDNQNITKMSELQNILSYYKKDEKITVTVMQHLNNKYVEKELEVVLGQK